ncbi:DEAD/DEAH box helicase [Coprobacter sp.]
MTSKQIILERLNRKLGITTLNEMQLSTLNCSEENTDMVLISPTGSGKTIAFLLPVILKLNPQCKNVQTLILVPSRELAIQIETVSRTISSGYKINCCYGGRPIKTESKSFQESPAILIGTPGRILDHIEHGRINTEYINTLVLDEFDKCLELGFQDQMRAIIKHLPNIQKRILTSATEGEIPEFTGLKNPRKICFEKKIADKKLSLFQVISSEQDKLKSLEVLLRNLTPGPTLIFCNHRESTERIGKFLTEQNIFNEIFHGGMEQIRRERALCRFKNGSTNIFISTDLASRGLDIPEIKHVIHYHLPTNKETFIHRNGRTARMFADGSAYLLINPEETIPEYIQDDHSGIFSLSPDINLLELPPMNTLYIGKGKKDKLNKVDIVGFLIQKGNLSKEDIGMIDIKEHYSYVAVNRKKINRTLRSILREKIKNMKAKYEIAR